MGNNYWGENRCYEEALKYKTRTEFFKNSRGAYKSALKNGWLNNICSHMLTQGSLYKRYNYIYEFPDNHAYIGLTCDIDRRNNDHFTDEKSIVYKHARKSGLIPILINDGLKDVKISQERESELISDYKKNGWIILNKSKAGGLGSVKTKLNKEKCQEEALKYKSRIEFQRASRSTYRFCITTKILDDVCSHMKIKWNKDICKNEALKYSTKREFYTNSQNAYRYSLRNDFLNEICEHMK